MEQQLPEPLKAILLRIALELKKFQWKSNSQTNEIDVFQGHLEMFKEWVWDGDGDIPDVNTSVGVDMTFVKNEQNGVYFLVYKANYQLFVDGVGGNDSDEDSDIDIPFTEQDANNMAKISQAAKQIDMTATDTAEEKAYEFSSNSSQAWRDYNSGGYKADQDLDR